MMIIQASALITDRACVPVTPHNDSVLALTTRCHRHRRRCRSDGSAILCSVVCVIPSCHFSHGQTVSATPSKASSAKDDMTVPVVMVVVVLAVVVIVVVVA